MRIGRVLVCIVVLGLVGLGGASSVAAQEPSPQELWEMYPLDPAGRGEGERPPQSPPPQSGVAGTVAPSPGRAQPVANTSRDDGAPLSLALLLGALAGAIILLATAALPVAAVPRMATVLTEHRLEIALAGGVTLIAVAVAFLVTAV